MVPGKKFEAPGKSPFMDMMLVPAYAGGDGADASTVTISPRIQQNLGLRIGEVTEGVSASEISAVGAIAWNERDQAIVQARAQGTYERMLKRQAKLALHVIEQVGLATLTDLEKQDQLEAVEERYGTGATLVTSQLPIADWHVYLGGIRSKAG